MSGPFRTVRVVIRGRVQGVGFRQMLADKARKLGVDGWCRNRNDGAVEAAFQGTRPSVESLIKFCQEGPGLARVDDIEVQAIEGDTLPKEFEIR